LLKHDSKLLFMFFHTLEYTRMSSMNTTTNLSNSDMNTNFMTYMKCADALVNPNGITRYSYRSYLIEKVVLGISLTQILI
jgi:hypothetical protein